MLQIMNKITGTIVQTDVKNCRNAIKNITQYEMEIDDCKCIKTSTVINSLLKGYEDKYIKARIIKGDWR